MNDPYEQDNELRLPFSEDTEKTIIGAIVMNNDLMDEVADVLSGYGVDVFHLRAYRLIYSAMCELHNAGRSIDAVSLSDKLTQQAKLQTVGGFARLSELGDGIPVMDTIRYWLEILLDSYHKRRLITVCQNAMSACFGNEHLPDILRIIDDGYVAAITGEVAHIEHASQPARRALQTMRSTARTGVLPGLVTGYEEIDDRMNGLEGLTILAARTSHGKTALALNWALNVAQRNETVLVFTIEMPSELYTMRLFSLMTEIDNQRLKRAELVPQEWTRLSGTVETINSIPLYFDESNAVNTKQIRTRARRLKRERGKLALIVVDYLNLMEAKEASARYIEVGQITRDLKELSKELNTPIVALAQLSRGIDAREEHTPTLSDLRESGNIEQDADSVIFLVNDWLYTGARADENKVRVIIAKNRNGPASAEFKLTFIPNFGKFEGGSIGEPE